MQEELRWFVPEYYSDFRCKCGECRNSCCTGWDIAIRRDEYYRLIGLECSEELHGRLECAFHPARSISPDHFQVISPDWRGDCHMHDENGLCMLHAECGEDALPEVCRMFPRSLKKCGETCFAVCTNSCEGVIEMLLALDGPLRFHMQSLAACPHEDRTGFDRSCLEALQAPGLPLPQRILRMVRKDGSDATQEAAVDMLLSALERIAGSANSIADLTDGAMRRYSGAERGALYAQDVARFECDFPDWAQAFENILANHLVYMNYPCADERLDEDGAAWGLCAVYGLMRLFAAACLRDKNAQEDFVDVMAGIFRAVEHASFYYNMRILIPDPAAMLLL